MAEISPSLAVTGLAEKLISKEPSKGVTGVIGSAFLKLLDN